MIALGGVACALGGAALGASGLAGPPSTHLTVSLLMIGKFVFCLLWLTTHNLFLTMFDSFDLLIVQIFIYCEMW